MKIQSVLNSGKKGMVSITTAWLVATYSLVVTWHANATIIETESQWTANYEYFRCIEFNCSIASASQTDSSQNGTAFTLDAPSQNVSGGSTHVEVDAEAGLIRSSTNVTVDLGISDTLSLEFISYNLVHIQDELSIAMDSGFIEIIALTTGSFSHDLRLETGDYLFGDLFADSWIQVAGGLGIRGGSFEIGNYESKLGSEISGPDTLSDQNFADAGGQFSVLAPFNMFDGPVPFTFDYIEHAKALVDYYDAHRAYIDVSNQFGSTLNLYAKVYDDNMVYQPNVAVNSAAGFSFQSVPAQTTVSEPGTMGLLCAATLMLLRIRRRLA